MDIPSSRNLELESLLRERDSQILQLTDEVTRSRQNASTQPPPSTSDPLTLPPSFVSLLLPHLLLPSPTVPHASHTVIAALNQRVGMLQEENDELYELLKKEEVGKLKDEVRGLRHAVEKLGGALRESHQVILTMSAELEKAYEALAAPSHQTNSASNAKAQSQSPRNSYLTSPQHNAPGNGHIAAKPPPTGPRSQKKQRVSDANASPPQSRFSGSNSGHKAHSNPSFSRNSDTREFRSSEHRSSNERKPNHMKMEIDQDRGVRRPSPSAERSRNRDRGHEQESALKDRGRAQRDRERDRDRDRDRDRERLREREREMSWNSNPRRNGSSGQSTAPHRGRGGSQGPAANPTRRTDRDRSSNSSITDRTLAERMGL